MENPKKSQGDKKAPLHLLPPIALEEESWVHKIGADKYGEWNWRESHVDIMTYIGATMRHLMAISKGEDIDPESGRSHWAHIGANANIVLDSIHQGCLIDNRPLGQLELF